MSLFSAFSRPAARIWSGMSREATQAARYYHAAGAKALVGQMWANGAVRRGAYVGAGAAAGAVAGGRDHRMRGAMLGAGATYGGLRGASYLKGGGGSKFLGFKGSEVMSSGFGGLRRRASSFMAGARMAPGSMGAVASSAKAAATSAVSSSGQMGLF